MISHNKSFKKDVKIPNGEYRMIVHNILWSISETELPATPVVLFSINKDIGYPGAKDNKDPLNVELVDPEIN